MALGDMVSGGCGGAAGQKELMIPEVLSSLRNSVIPRLQCELRSCSLSSPAQTTGNHHLHPGRRELCVPLTSKALQDSPNSSWFPRGSCCPLAPLLFSRQISGLQIPGLPIPRGRIPLCWIPSPLKCQICQAWGRKSKPQLKDKS